MVRRVSCYAALATACVAAGLACGREVPATPATPAATAATVATARDVVPPAGLASTVLGLVEAEATAKIAKAGYTWRILGRDGQNFPATMDFVDTRIGLKITGGKVTEARVG